jgi:hypothetical protein
VNFIHAFMYESIIFMQGDDANQPLDLLYSRESDDSIVYHGPTAESVTAALEYLRQWDNGDATEQCADPSSGTSDDTWEQDGYRLSASLSYGYIGLERIVMRTVESYRCPCCGDDVIDSPPVCGACRDADCQPTVDACGELGYWGCDRADTDAYAVDGAA